MIKKTFKYLLSIFIFGLGLFNFSYGYELHDLGLDFTLTNTNCGRITEHSFGDDYSFSTSYLGNNYNNIFYSIGGSMNSASCNNSTSYFALGRKNEKLYMFVKHIGVSAFENQGYINKIAFCDDISQVSTCIVNADFDLGKNILQNYKLNGFSYFVNSNFLLFNFGYNAIVKFCFELKDYDSKYMCFLTTNLNSNSNFIDSLGFTPTSWNSPEGFNGFFDNSPFVSSAGGGGQRFPINGNRPGIKGSSMVREYTNNEILSAFDLYGFDKNYSCYAGIPINGDYSGYVLGSGASIFDIVSNFYDLGYTSVSQFSDYDLEVASKWLDYYASSVESSHLYYTPDFGVFNGFYNGVLSSQSHGMQSLFYYGTTFGQFGSRKSIDIVNYCRLVLDSSLSGTGVYSGTLPDIPILNNISFDDNGNAIGFAWDFGTGESMLSALSGENIDYDFIGFASDLKDKFQSIFIGNAYHTTGIIPEYILGFLMLFLLFKFLRK